jgi:hypothetical protein
MSNNIGDISNISKSNIYIGSSNSNQNISLNQKIFNEMRAAINESHELNKNEKKQIVKKINILEKDPKNNILWEDFRNMIADYSSISSTFIQIIIPYISKVFGV